MLLHPPVVRKRRAFPVPGHGTKMGEVRRVARVGVGGDFAVAKKTVPRLVFPPTLASLVPVDLLEAPGTSGHSRGAGGARQERGEVVVADAREKLREWGERRRRRGSGKVESNGERMPNRAISYGTYSVAHVSGFHAEWEYGRVL